MGMMWLCGGLGMVRCGDAMECMSSKQQLLMLGKAKSRRGDGGATPRETSLVGLTGHDVKHCFLYGLHPIFKM